MAVSDMFLDTMRMMGLIALIILFMFIPFLPGRYDSLATTISFMAQVFSFTGLLLIPVGLGWLLLEFQKRKSKRAVPAKAAIIVSGIVVVTVSVGAVSAGSLLTGVIFFIFCITLLVTTFWKVREVDFSANPNFNSTPLYVVIIPAVAFLVRFILITPAVEYSQRRAIENSSNLIQNIEHYYHTHGHYPVSLQALHANYDYPPSVVGISQYFYEQNGNAYNLYFKQPSDKLDMERIVMYNKLDEHRFAVHAKDILEFTGEELALRRGDRQMIKLPTRHWVYFEFD
jgi:hypothetical protein